MSDTTNPCYFCGRTDTKLTKEHLHRKEMGRKLGATSGEMMFEAVYAEEGGENSTRYWRAAKSPYEWTVGGYCDVCNNGWMNDADIAVESVHHQLIVGSRATLDRSEMDSMAFWAAKTAAVRSSVDAPFMHHPVDDRRWMAQTHSVPQSWQVWLAGRTSDPLVQTRHTAGQVADDDDPNLIETIRLTALC